MQLGKGVKVAYLENTGFHPKTFISIENRADLFCPDKSHHISARMAAETFNIHANVVNTANELYFFTSN